MLMLTGFYLNCDFIEFPCIIFPISVFQSHTLLRVMDWNIDSENQQHNWMDMVACGEGT